MFDEPMIGQSRYGEYYLYAVKNGTDTEYSFFAPDDVHDKLKALHKGERFEITKVAEQKGNKVITRHDVKMAVHGVQSVHPENNSDKYFSAMLCKLSRCTENTR